jgi:hemoglobin/transferrin/lactoferrin receptor protein
VLVRTNTASVDLKGVEQRFQARLTPSFTLRQNFSITYARDNVSGLPPDIEGGIPPATANLSLLWTPAGKRFWVEPYATLAGRQDRLSALALSDRRIGATRSRANIASFFNNGAAVRGLVAGGLLRPTGETLAQVQNRVLGSADSAPMFTAIPGWALFGVRAGWTLGERSELLADFNNLTDRNYRGLSWGIDGPGIGLTVRWRYRY